MDLKRIRDPEAENQQIKRMFTDGYPYSRDKFIGFKRELTDLSSDKNLFWKYILFKENCPSAKILDGPNSHIKGYENNYGTNGYMTLNFVDDKLFEVVFDADGRSV